LDRRAGRVHEGAAPVLSGSAVYRRLRSVAVVVVLGACAIALTQIFHDTETDALRAQTQLTVISEQLNAQDALEWQAVSGLVPIQTVRRNLDASRTRTDDAMGKAVAYGLSATTAGTLRRLVLDYTTAVDRELSLIEAGDQGQAREFDETVVDPTFRAVQPELKDAAVDLTNSGERAERLDHAGVIGTILLALVAVFVLEQRWDKSRSQLEQLSQARYRALVDTSNDYVLIVGPDHEVLYASPAAELAGLDAQFAHVLELVHPDDQTSAARLFTAGVDEVSDVAELRLRHAELGWRICEVSVTTLRRKEGDEKVIVAHDVTERAQAQEAAAAARDAAVEASQLKSMFLATMSHEIRTPMNGVIGMTSLLADTNLDAEQREYTQTIRSSGESLLAIINDILDFSKIEAGQLELENHPFVLTTCVQDAMDVVAPLAVAKGIELLYESRDLRPTVVLGDVTRLRQILVNLLSNAVKFTPHGEIVVKMSCQETAADTIATHVTVADQGIGISEDQLTHLFQPFAQADASTTRTHGGTGLGLAICRRLAAAMGGELWAESEPGRGSVFHLTAPFRVTEAPTLLEPPLVDLELRGKHALVVDDSDTNRAILQHQLASWEITSRDSRDPSEALDWARSGERFDIAILDMHMPNTTGVALASQLRSTAAGRHLPLILLSSLGDRPSAVDAAQFAAILTKPVKPSALCDAVANALAHRKPPVSTDQESSTVPRGGAAAAPQRLRVLLAEDNVVNQKVALGTLNRLGYRADIAGNGLEVLQALQRQHYDVVLMDVHMPELDGLDATRRIREELPDHRQPRIIAMTANAFAEDRDRCIEAGMDDYISKPVRKEALGAALAWEEAGSYSAPSG
jgi:PAS domain S-box-containing protein